jgi:hypothetical protein
MTDVLMGALIVGAVILGAIGLLFTSQATLGVGLIALACLSAILARLAQASYHRKLDRR